MCKYVSLSYHHKSGKWCVYSRNMLEKDARDVVRQLIKDGCSTIMVTLQQIRLREPDWSYVAFHRRDGRGGPVPLP